MTFSIIISSIFLILYTICRVNRAYEMRREEAFRGDILIFKLNTIKRFYPEAQDLSYMELVQRYDCEEAYNRLTYR